MGLYKWCIVCANTISNKVIWNKVTLFSSIEKGENDIGKLHFTDIYQKLLEFIWQEPLNYIIDFKCQYE